VSFDAFATSTSPKEIPMPRIRALVLAGAALLLPACLAAQNTPATPVAPSHLAAARELIEAVRLSEVAAAGVNISIDEQIRADPALEPFRTTMKQWGAEIFASEEAKNAYAQLYASTFSEAELRQLVAFYRTPLGRKLATSQATLSMRGAEIGRTLAEARQADLTARLQSQMPKP
jgi:hypothetical protein